MAKAFGLDIGSQTVKLAVVEGSAKKFKVTKFVSREVGEVGGVAETVSAVLREGKAGGDNLVVALDSKSVVIREILVPFLEDDQIRRVLRYEAEAHLHNYAIEDVVVDYLKVGEVKDQSKVLIFAAPKEELRARLDILQSQGVDPMHVHLDMAALFNAAEGTGAFLDHPNAILLDIGATTTNLLFVRDARLKSVRSVRSGAESLTRVLSQDLALDTDSARDRAREGDGSGRPDDLLTPIPLEDDEVPDTEKSAAELETAIVVQRQNDFLTRIFRETSRSLATVSVESQYTAIYITGGASLTQGLRRRLADRFGQQVLPLDFLGGETRIGDYEKVNAGIGVAMGCALKLIGQEPVKLEFRREDLRYTRKFDLIKVALASAVSLVFILLFLVWLNAQNTLRVRRYEHTSINTLAESKYVKPTVRDYQEVLGEEAKRLPGVSTDTFKKIPTWQRQVATMLKHITSEMGYDVEGVPPIRSALELWKLTFDKLEERRRELGYLFVDTIKVNQKTITIDGQIGERGHVDRLVVELKKLKFGSEQIVEKVDRDRSEADPKTGKIKFGLTIYLKPTKVEK